jgi:DNA-directed RNA polymerase subunit beta-beta'
LLHTALVRAEVFASSASHLDERGAARVGQAVEPGMVLVGKRHGERDVSFHCPLGVRGTVTSVDVKERQIEVTVTEQRPAGVGDILRLADGTVEVVAAVVDELDADLEWPDVQGERKVERVASAQDAMHARSIGPYSLVTQQPLKDRAQYGGQRIGAAELDALEERGAAWTAYEMLTVKSDDIDGRAKLYESIVRGIPESVPVSARSTEVLQAELLALGFEVDLTAEHVAIRLWSDAAIRERVAGVVKKPETINYRTHKPERDGLFCEAIFGDVKDGQARARTLGRIDLAIPVMHPWLLETAATLLDNPKLEDVLYCERTIDGELVEETEHTGPRAIREALAKLDLATLARGSGSRAELARAMIESKTTPTQLCYEVWPVLPPDLRPLVPLEGGRFATSDLNDLYRRVINRNNRLRRLLELQAPPIILINETRELQRAVDSVVQNGLRAPKVKFESRPLVSLAEMIGGPKGRFAINADGKRVDYSAIAHVVPADLATDRVRVPRAVALELFTPWIYADLERQGFATTIRDSKRLVERLDPRALTSLVEITRGYPVLMYAAVSSSPAAIGSLDIELWDEPAFGLATSMITALGLTHGASAILHVPIDGRAIAEVKALRKPAAMSSSGQPGWILRAAESSDIGRTLVDAALAAEIDYVEDRKTRRILSRLTKNT